MDVERACPACGRARGEGDRYCAQCGRAFQEPAPEPAQQPSWHGNVLPSNIDPASAAATRSTPWRAVQRPLLVSVLVLATFNLYALWWLGRTWWQLKQEDGDARKRPVWHALAMLVPIYGYFRFYAHMRTILHVAATPEARATISPAPMTVAWIVINVLSGTAGTLTDAPWWSLVLASVLCAALIGWAQHGLNRAWRSLPGSTVSARLHPLHVLLLGFGGLIYAWTVLVPVPA